MDPVCLRDFGADEVTAVKRRAHSHAAPAQSVQRAQIIWRAGCGESASAISACLCLDGETMRKHIHCFSREAAYLNLIEPWWRVPRSLALAGARFESWDEIIDAIRRSTAYWNAHRRPFVWGKRRRHRLRRSPSIALLPGGAWRPG